MRRQNLGTADGGGWRGTFLPSFHNVWNCEALRILISYRESAIIGTPTLFLILGDLHFQIIISQSPRTNSQINRFETSHPGLYISSYLDFDNIALHISDTDTGFCYQEDQQFECSNVWMHVDVDHNVWW